MTFLPNQPFRKQVRYTEDGGDLYDIPVTVVNMDEDEDGETIYSIRLPITGQGRIAYADELSPTPDAPATVSELIDDLLTWASPLMHAFVMDALLKQAEAVVLHRETVIKQMEGGFIYGPAWVACAEEVVEKLGKQPA